LTGWAYGSSAGLKFDEEYADKHLPNPILALEMLKSKSPHSIYKYLAGVVHWLPLPAVVAWLIAGHHYPNNPFM
jgi:hypothetical protein